MKLKILIILLALAGLLAGLAYYSVRKKPFSMSSAIGGKVFPNLAVNRVGKLVVTSKNGVTTVAKSKGKWLVASRFNYPANFDKAADMIRDLSELKVGQTVHANSSQLGAFNLVSPGPTGPNQSSNTGTAVELRDEKDGALASLLIGKEFMRPGGDRSREMMMNFGGYPDPAGQYVQTFDGKVYLVSKILDRLTEPAKTWLADDFINASPSDIKEITVSGPDRVPIKLIRVKDGDSFTLTDLLPKDGDLESSKVNQITGALNRLGFDDVADPALSLKETGLDRPIVFKAITKDGLIYSLQLGNILANDNFDRYFAVSVTNAPAADQQASEKAEQGTDSQKDRPDADRKNISEQAAELNGKFGAWIYVIKSYRAEPMLLTRDDLIRKPEPPKPEDSSQKSVIRKTDEK